MISALGVALFFTGILIGVTLAWIIISSRFNRDSSELQVRARSSEALLTELRGQLMERNVEAEKLRDAANTERQLKTEALAMLETEKKHFQEELVRFEAIRTELSDTFKALSLDALTRNTDEFKRYADNFMQLAEEKLKSLSMEGKKELQGKKELIDQNIEAINTTLADVRKRIEEVGKSSGERITEVATLIRKHEEVTLRLRDTTEHLGQALTSSKKRGEWGERMAEDILRLVGLSEGINYVKQKTLEHSPGRPDYTFFLPKNLKINMDVKFPLENYTRYLNTEAEHDRKRYREDLLRNTRTMLKQVTSREYINAADNTVDYVIVFIPNEQVYGFINESDPFIIDEALKQKVVLCSPFTLYAVLSVIRQATENFNLEKTASEILKLLTEFSKHWNLYKERFKVMGDRLDAARKEYDTLSTTRSTMLERSLRKIDELSRQKDITLETGIDIDDTAD